MDLQDFEGSAPLTAISRNVAVAITLLSPNAAHLLKTYGSVVFIDFTYKTTNCGWPLGALVVHLPTGHYHLAALFLTPLEDAQSIRDVLLQISKQVPTWQPHAFVMDCARSLRNAVRGVFPDAHTFLCVFHVLQGAIIIPFMQVCMLLAVQGWMSV